MAIKKALDDRVPYFVRFLRRLFTMIACGALAARSSDKPET